MALGILRYSKSVANIPKPLQMNLEVEMGNPKQRWTAGEEEILRVDILQGEPDFKNHLHSHSNIYLKGKQCYICGVAGFEELIATCMGCKSIFVHLYCMKTVQFVIPNDWMCEDCLEIPEQEKPHTAKRTVDEQMPSAVRESFKKQKSCIKDFAHTRTPSSLSKPSLDLESFKELFIPTHTASEKSRRGLAQGDNSYKVNLKGNKNTRYQRLNGVDTCKGTLKISENTRDQRLTGEKWKVDRYLPNHPASVAIWKCGIYKKWNSKMFSQEVPFELFSEFGIVKLLLVKFMTDFHLNVSKRHSIYSQDILLFCTFRGCFNISGLSAPVSPWVTVWGYPPAKVRKKAYNFSKKMPDFLTFKAIPRCAVWEMFNDGAPDKNDNGLYFFPNDDRSEQIYSWLVSHLEKQDIVLKSCICGIDLLIFSSSFLDEKSKEINQAHYLWGLFVDPASTFKEPYQVQLPSEKNAEAPFEHRGENEKHADKEVKLEKWEGEELPCAPGFPAAVPRVIPSVPPGFEDEWRVKYKTIREILQSPNGK